jgi:hypothetical protein
VGLWLLAAISAVTFGQRVLAVHRSAAARAAPAGPAATGAGAPGDAAPGGAATQHAGGAPDGPA